jgi:hypothetical protein
LQENMPSVLWDIQKSPFMSLDKANSIK